MADRIVRLVAGLFLWNGRIMSKKQTEVKEKEGYNPESGKRSSKNSKAFRLREKFARLAVAEDDAHARKLLGKGRETLPGLIQITSAFEAQVPAIGIFQQNVVTEFARDMIQGTHKSVLSR